MSTHLNKTRGDLRVIAKVLIAATIIPYFLTEEEIINELELFYKTANDHELLDNGKNLNRYRRGWLLKANDIKKRKRYPTRKE